MAGRRMTSGEVIVDVLVIGGGGSGLAAAITAASEGRKVLLLEKNPRLGGSTAWSVGSFSASGTADQRREKIEDDAEAHFEDMGKFTGDWAERDNLEMRRVLARAAGDTLEWLRSLGVRFFGPIAEPPHRVPRMHNVLPNAAAYIHHLEREARRVGVEIWTGASAEELISDARGVIGANVRRQGMIAPVFARNGVILAGGDYSASEELKQRFGAVDVAKVPPVNPTATGDCHRMAMSLGGHIVNGDVSFGPIIRFVPPPRASLSQIIPPWSWLMTLAAWGLRSLPTGLLRPMILSFMTTVLGPEASLFRDGALLVGSDGGLIGLEGKTPGMAVAGQADNMAYILLDSRLAAVYSGWPHFISTAPGVAYAYFPDYRKARPDLVHEASRIEDFRPNEGFDSARLARELADRTGDLQRSQGPSYLMGPMKGFVPSTDGGLATDNGLRVLDGSNEPIVGLFAAGSNGQTGLLLMGHGHHIAWAFVSGRLAGRNAARSPSRDISGATLE